VHLFWLWEFWIWISSWWLCCTCWRNPAVLCRSSILVWLPLCRLVICLPFIDEIFFYQSINFFCFRSLFYFCGDVFFQCNLQLKCSTRYFTASVWVMLVWLILTAGQWPFWRVNITCVDFETLTLIFKFFSHFSMMCDCSWRLGEAIKVSSINSNICIPRNVSNFVSQHVVKSNVYSTYRGGASMLPWGTPEWMCKRLEFCPLILLRVGLRLGTIS